MYCTCTCNCIYNDDATESWYGAPVLRVGFCWNALWYYHWASTIQFRSARVENAMELFMEWRKASKLPLHFHLFCQPCQVQVSSYEVDLLSATKFIEKRGINSARLMNSAGDDFLPISYFFSTSFQIEISSFILHFRRLESKAQESTPQTLFLVAIEIGWKGTQLVSSQFTSFTQSTYTQRTCQPWLHPLRMSSRYAFFTIAV